MISCSCMPARHIILHPICRRIRDDQSSARVQTTNSLRNRTVKIFGVMKRSVEDGAIELPVRKRKIVELGLEPRKKFRQLRSVTGSCSQPIPSVREQINRPRPVPLPPQAVRHPTVSRTKIENQERRIAPSRNSRQNFRLKQAKRLRADHPPP